MGAIKDLLKYILPPPVSAFNREVGRILENQERHYAHLAELQDQLRKENELQSEDMRRRLESLSEQLEHLGGQLETLASGYRVLEDGAQAMSQKLEPMSAQLETLGRQMDGTLQTAAALTDRLTEFQKENLEKYEMVRKRVVDGSRNAAEAAWAAVFHDTIRNSRWLADASFSPGRWAVGYPYLYAMYRVLNETHPKRILDLGLGQTTSMLAQYAAAFEDVEHIVVEHDPEWIQFFYGQMKRSDRTRLIALEREMSPFRDAAEVRCFKSIRESFEGQTFDFISIDAPLGADMKQYARIDVLNMMPQCLGRNFVVMMDDAERPGERHTISAMEDCLNEHGIPYRRGNYNGKKDCVLLCAQSVGFLATM